jgi:hypothetical protein
MPGKRIGNVVDVLREWMLIGISRKTKAID